MKKLNNKGFAITTVIYGLAILGILLMALLMSTLSQARTNNNDITRSIEDELNRFSQTETPTAPAQSWNNGHSSYA